MNLLRETVLPAELVGEQATLLCTYKRSPDLKAFFSRDLKEFPAPGECT